MLARALGVSQGLVSLILAGKRGVTDDIAAKVEKVYIDAL
jgi:plasmid maintenance system antidote protein VapI